MRRQHWWRMRRRTQAALDMWQEMGSKASTPSTVLPAKRLRLDPAEPAPQQPPAQPRGSVERDDAGAAAEVEAK